MLIHDDKEGKTNPAWLGSLWRERKIAEDLAEIAMWKDEKNFYRAIDKLSTDSRDVYLLSRSYVGNDNQRQAAKNDSCTYTKRQICSLTTD